MFFLMHIITIIQGKKGKYANNQKDPELFIDELSFLGFPVAQW